MNDDEKYLPLYSSDIQRASLRFSIWGSGSCVMLMGQLTTSVFVTREQRVVDNSP